MIVDDDRYILESLQIFLEMEDYLVKECDGKNVLAVVESFKPQIIIMDIWLPGENGLDLSKAIKDVPANKNVKIILSSATSHVQDYVNKPFIDDIIEKPFDTDLLLQKITALSLT